MPYYILILALARPRGRSVRAAPYTKIKTQNAAIMTATNKENIMQLKSQSSETISRTHEVPLEIKAGAEPGTFEGYGSIYDSVDRDGDIVTRGTFTNSLKMRTPALLWQHNPKEPIGRFDEVREDTKGLYVKGRLTREGRGKEAYELLKMGALNGLSVGFVTKESLRDDTSGVRTITKADLMEISLVTFPANELARVHAVKSASYTADAPTSRNGFLKLLQQKGFDMRHAMLLSTKGFEAQSGEQKTMGEIVERLNPANLLNLVKKGRIRKTVNIKKDLWGDPDEYVMDGPRGVNITLSGSGNIVGTQMRVEYWDGARMATKVLQGSGSVSLGDTERNKTYQYDIRISLKGFYEGRVTYSLN